MGKAILDLETTLKKQYYQSLVGERLQLLVEKVHADGTASGTSCRYASTRATVEHAEENTLVDVKIDSANEFLRGRQLKNTSA